VQSYNLPKFGITLRPGEIFLKEIISPGQKNRMFMTIAPNIQ
jgi:hypothetical protein